MEAALRARKRKARTDAAARTKRTKTNDDHDGCPQPVPKDMVEEILSRLPVKSLKRFRCVSRAWHAVITSAAFEGLHLQRFSGGGNNNRVVFLDPRGACYPMYAWKLGGPLETISSIRVPQGKTHPITKSCHGLLLLHSADSNTHYVWNPSTSETMALPDRIHTISYVAYGIGYCPTSNRYKVVRMYNRGVGDELPEVDTACEVFTLGESTHWRPAATQPPACKIRVQPDQGAVLCNGNLHFVQHRNPNLLAFNVSSETFDTVELPLEVISGSTMLMLTELDGYLCAYELRIQNPYHIWLLKDYEAGEWKKLRCIDWGSVVKTDSATRMFSWIAPIDMYYDDKDEKKKIMFDTGTSKVFVVDPDTGNPEIVFSPDSTVIGERTCRQFPTMGLFQESLVSIGPTSEEIMFSSPSVLSWSEVLTYLPARTVARLNQVCRGWRAMIKSECFIDAHMYCANLNKSPRIMLIDGKPHGFRRLEDLISTSDVPPLVDDDGLRVACSKPCHGLNAGSIGKFDFVCNPVTNYYKATNYKGREWSSRRNNDTLDSFNYIIQRSPRGSVKDGCIGLGFDHDVGMHVLVRLVYKKRDLTTRDYELKCMMRLVNQRGWFLVEPPPPRPVVYMPPVFIDGKFYWMADPKLWPRLSVDGCCRCEIVMLDVITTEFYVLEGPVIGSDDSGRTTVIELGGEVCVAHSKQSTNTIEIWAADGNDVGSGMWSVRHRVELARFSPEYSLEEAMPLAIDPCDGRILLSTGRALGYYDTTTMEVETIYRLGPLVPAGKKFVPILYMDSLVEP